MTMYYSDYLQLDKILGAQDLESEKAGKSAHDEMLFIVIHQSYELWFKQVLYELRSVIEIFEHPRINDNSPELQFVAHRLYRVTEILKVLVQQLDILETMTPLDFLDFRDLLRPASGFQSVQFKELEAVLGLNSGDRHASHYYRSQLKEEDLEKILSYEGKPSLAEVINLWLERMPYFDSRYWEDDFWTSYQKSYTSSLANEEEANTELFKTIFSDSGESRFSGTAKKSALFIMLYRGYPLLHLPFRILNHLLDIDELLASWRYRHMNMVHRMIGSRVGTGGSTGKMYLKGAADKHYIFSELADLNSFLIERGRIPDLPVSLQRELGFRS